MEADLEERLEVLEEALFGDEEPGEMDTMYGKKPLAQCVQDCREDLDNIFDTWGPALDRHLGADWCEDDKAAGD